MGAVSYLDRVNISIAGQTIAAEYHLTTTDLGLVFSAFTVGYAIFQLIGGWAADRFGPRRTLMFGVFWWTVFTILTASVPRRMSGALLLFLLFRFMLGAGESVIYPSSNRWMANWIPDAERGFANGIIFAGIGAGAALTPPIIAEIMMHYGWRVAFWICGFLGLAVGVGWYRMARDSPEQHLGVSRQELTLISEGTMDRETSLKRRISWAVILRSKDVWALTLSYFCYGYVAYIFFAWFFIYLTTVRGLTFKRGSFYTMLPFIAMSLCSALGGFVSDTISKRWGRRLGRCGVAMLGMSLAAMFIACGTLTRGATGSAVIMAAGAGALYLAQSSYWALSADLGGPSSGSLSAFMNMGAQVGGAVTTVLTAFIAVHLGWTTSFITAAAFCAIGSLSWLFVNPDCLLTENQYDL